jgi:hypothetical protein
MHPITMHPSRSAGPALSRIAESPWNKSLGAGVGKMGYECSAKGETGDIVHLFVMHHVSHDIGHQLEIKVRAG